MTVGLTNKETVKNCANDLRNMLEDSTIIERKSFVKNFIREAKVTGSKIMASHSHHCCQA